MDLELTRHRRRKGIVEAHFNDSRSAAVEEEREVGAGGCIRVGVLGFSEKKRIYPRCGVVIDGGGWVS